MKKQLILSTLLMLAMSMQVFGQKTASSKHSVIARCTLPYNFMYLDTIAKMNGHKYILSLFKEGSGGIVGFDSMANYLMNQKKMHQSMQTALNHIMYDVCITKEIPIYDSGGEEQINVMKIHEEIFAFRLGIPKRKEDTEFLYFTQSLGCILSFSSRKKGKKTIEYITFDMIDIDPMLSPMPSGGLTRRACFLIKWKDIKNKKKYKILLPDGREENFITFLEKTIFPYYCPNFIEEGTKANASHLYGEPCDRETTAAYKRQKLESGEFEALFAPLEESEMD